ncbi:unnamed protein product, partial [marine sediment metagenome]
LQHATKKKAAEKKRLEVFRMGITLELEEVGAYDQLMQGYLQGTIEIIALSNSFSINPYKQLALHARSR